jgi:hypothetical protein
MTVKSQYDLLELQIWNNNLHEKLTVYLCHFHWAQIYFQVPCFKVSVICTGGMDICFKWAGTWGLNFCQKWVLFSSSSCLD